MIAVDAVVQVTREITASTTRADILIILLVGITEDHMILQILLVHSDRILEQVLQLLLRMARSVPDVSTPI